MTLRNCATPYFLVLLLAFTSRADAFAPSGSLTRAGSALSAYARKNKDKGKPKGPLGSRGKKYDGPGPASPQRPEGRRAGASDENPRAVRRPVQGEGRGPAALRPLSGRATRPRNWDTASDWSKPATRAEALAALAATPAEILCEHFNTCSGCSADRRLTQTPVRPIAQRAKPHG